MVPTLILMNEPGPRNTLKWWAATVFRLGFACGVLGTFASFRRKQEDDKHASNNDGEPSTLEMLLRLLFVASPFETIMMQIGLERFTLKRTSWLAFVPMTFIFEVLMDLSHYIAHRLMHSNATIYKMSGHKTHHAVHKPTALATFCQDPLDVVLSNVIPVLGSLWVMDRGLGMRFTKEQLILALGLKTYVEVAGHVGILDGHATSFPQFVWLPRLFGVELHTKDHDLHHTQGGRHNFGKRFTLFDRLFGTYKPS
jgi:sterol desaturase/sphingolipid hydroxylase (fatty acid hydroxylase superfamily)